jgi:hypothetical protein
VCTGNKIDRKNSQLPRKEEKEWQIEKLNLKKRKNLREIRRREMQKKCIAHIQV